MSTAPLPGLNPCAQFQTAKIVEQVSLARDTYRMRLECPEIAKQILPGQFFMLRSPDQDDPLLGRPFALYDVVRDADGTPVGVDFGYAVIGKMTTLLTQLKTGDSLEIWGPLGNGFALPQGASQTQHEKQNDRLTCVAGGIGYTPFVAVSKETLGLSQYGSRQAEHQSNSVSLLYGTRSKEFCANMDDLNLPGLEIQIATDDGSEGHHGLVTDLLKRQLKSETPPHRVYCCGPVPMMKAVSDICRQAKVDCWVSLETPMACGFGACFSCVTKVKQDDGTWDYLRTCVEGPVFKADEVIL